MSKDPHYDVLNHVLSAYGPDGWAIEFGVHTGTSLSYIAEHMPVIGLDSFEGLPEDWREGFEKGVFAKDILVRLPGHTRNVMLVEGWYEETVPWLVRRGLPPIGLVHVDCDLYSSTMTALEGIIDYLKPGTYVVFDEFHGYPGHEDHESKAWYEITTTYGITYELIATGAQSAAFLIHDVAEF